MWRACRRSWRRIVLWKRLFPSATAAVILSLFFLYTYTCTSNFTNPSFPAPFRNRNVSTRTPNFPPHWTWIGTGRVHPLQPCPTGVLGRPNPPSQSYGVSLSLLMQSNCSLYTQSYGVSLLLQSNCSLGLVFNRCKDTLRECEGVTRLWCVRARVRGCEGAYVCACVRLVAWVCVGQCIIFK